jgi:hypothetical protein
MRLMEKITRVSLVTLGVMTAALALALAQPQPQPSAPPGAYPNTDNFGVDVDRQEPWFKECMRVEKVQP